MSTVIHSDRSWLRLFAFWRPPFSKRRMLTMGLILVAGLTMTYLTLYGKLLVGETKYIETDLVTQRFVIVIRPHYSLWRTSNRTQFSWLEAFFEPAHQIDRWIRPEKWPSPSWCKNSDSSVPAFSQPQ